MSIVFRRLWPLAAVPPESAERVRPEGARRAWIVGLLALFVIGVFLVAGIRITYMHPDEYLVYRFTRDDLGSTVRYLAEQDVHPPLWFSFFWTWRRIAGDSEFAGRMQAIGFSLVALAVVYQLGRCWFAAPRYGLFAMAALAANGLFFQYGLEIRPYGLALLLSSLSMLAFWRWLTRRTWRAAAWYAASLAALLYVHYFLGMLILVQAIYFVLTRPTRRQWRQGVGVALIAFALWSPWLPGFVNQVIHLRSVEVEAGTARGLLGTGATTQPTSVESIANLAQLATNGQVLLYAVVLVAGAVLVGLKSGYRLVLWWAFGVPIIAFSLNMVAAVYTPRYIVNFILGLSLALGAALAALPPRIRWAALVAFVGVSLWALPSQLPQDRVPYRDIVRTFAASARAGDAVFYDNANERDDIWRWEVGRQFVPGWGGYRANTIDEALAAQRVWFVTADWLNPAVQANFRAIEAAHPLKQVIGDCNRYWCFLIQLLETVPSDEG